MNDILILQWVQIILFIVAVALAIFSLKIAIRSLRESEKSRRDMFLPIIISKSISSDFSGKYVWFYLQNIGHGVALQPKIRLVGIKDMDIIEGYHTEASNIQAVTPLEFMDHRISQGYYHWAFDLTNVDFNTLLNSKLKLKMLYDDIFERQIKTTYNLTLKKDGKYYQFHLNYPEVQLPK